MEDVSSNLGSQTACVSEVDLWSQNMPPEMMFLSETDRTQMVDSLETILEAKAQIAALFDKARETMALYGELSQDLGT